MAELFGRVDRRIPAEARAERRDPRAEELEDRMGGGPQVRPDREVAKSASQLGLTLDVWDRAEQRFQRLSEESLPSELRAEHDAGLLSVPLEVMTILEPQADVRHGVVVHNADVGNAMQKHYTPDSLSRVKAILDPLGTLDIRVLPNGLPQAAEVRENSSTKARGYDAVWTRDTCLIVETWLRTGQTEKAVRAVGALLAYYRTGNQNALLLGGVNAAASGDVAWAKANRPHIKLNGADLTDLTEPWGHAQDDALGLMLKEAFGMARAGSRPIEEPELRSMVLLIAYLKGIDYTTDKENGHWEEAGREGGKISASTLACVVAGLEEVRKWIQEDPSRADALQRLYEEQVGDHAQRFMDFRSGSTLNQMIDSGRSALQRLLPYESRGNGPYRRLADLALTTVVFLDLQRAPQDRVMSVQLRNTVLANLQGGIRRSHGDARYAGDGYFGAFWDENNPDLTQQMNDAALEDRLAGGMREQGEAQWTLGAGMMSTIWGILYRETGRVEYLERETLELNRALGMVTGSSSLLGPGTIPEAYMMTRISLLERPQDEMWTFHENGLPLNWSKANLGMAMAQMKESLELLAERGQ